MSRAVLFEDDTDSITFTLTDDDGTNPDLTTVTSATLWVRNKDTGANTSVAGTNLTAAGAVTFDFTTICASVAGAKLDVYEQPRIKIVDGADESTYPVTHADWVNGFEVRKEWT